MGLTSLVRWLRWTTPGCLGGGAGRGPGTLLLSRRMVEMLGAVDSWAASEPFAGRGSPGTPFLSVFVRGVGVQPRLRTGSGGNVMSCGMC